MNNVTPMRRLDTFTKEEWWDVCRQCDPDLTPEKYDDMWAAFLRYKIERAKELKLLVEFPGSAPNDIPRMLRLLADDMDAGSVLMSCAVLVGKGSDGEARVYTWGTLKDDELTAIGLLSVAQTLMVGNFELAE